MIMAVVLALLFMLGQLGRLSLLNQEVNLYLFEAVYFTWFFYQLLFKKRKLWLNNLKAPSLAFLGVLWVTFIIGIPSVDEQANLISSLYLIRLSLYVLSFSVLVGYLSGLSKRQKSVLGILILGLTLVPGIAQYLLYPNLRNLQYLGWDPHQSRLFGQFLETSVMAGVIGLNSIYLLVSYKKETSMQTLAFAATHLIAGLLTYSRGFFIAILGSLTFYVAQTKKYMKAVVVMIVMLLLIVFASPKPFGEGGNLLRMSTIRSRAADYQEGLRIFQKHPLFGIGYNRIRYFKDQGTDLGRGASHAGASFHSSFLIVLVTSGLLGLIAFLYWLLALAKISQYALLGVVFLSIFSLFDNLLLHPLIMFLFTFYVGLSFTSRSRP